jgi:predicted small lipoprotein YifL
MKQIAVILMVCLTLTACGRRGAPSAPGPASAITYPQTYPAQ